MRIAAKIMLGLMAAAFISCANANKAGGADNSAATDTIPPVSQDIPGTDTDTLANPDEETVKP